MFFFFSSRRRHTRYWRDWSSDVCSSDLHMIGGYAQLSYGFNYYGTVGANRDEFVVVRKMSKVDWLEEPFDESAVKRGPRSEERRVGKECSSRWSTDH